MVYPTDEPQDTGLDLINRNPGQTTLEAQDAQGMPIEVELGEDGTSIIVIPGTEVTGPITIIVTDPELTEPIYEDVSVASPLDPGSSGSSLGSSDGSFLMLLAALGLLTVVGAPFLQPIAEEANARVNAATAEINETVRRNLARLGLRF